MNKIKFDPIHFISYGITFCIIAYIIGPYKWEIKNWDSIMVLLIGIVCICLGMIVCKVFRKKYKITIGNIKPGSLENSDRTFQITALGEIAMIIIDIGVIVAFCLYIRNISTYISFSSISNLSDTRYLLADNLSFVQKLVNYLVLAGIPIYIISGYEPKIKIRPLRWIRTICFWLPAISFLLTGARWNFVLSVFIFFIVNFDNKNSAIYGYVKKNKIGFLFSIIMIVLLLIVTLILFQTRGLTKGITTQMPYYGSVGIKEWYQGVNSLGKGFYQIFLYITHSVPYYSSIYSQIDFSHPQFGTYAFSHLRIFFSNFRNWNQFVQYNPVLTGSYTPTVTGFFIDFGFWGAFVAMFFTGYIFEYICEKAESNMIMRCLKPVVLFQCFMVLEGYVLTVAATNILAFLIVVISVGIMLINRFAKVKRA